MVLFIHSAVAIILAAAVIMLVRRFQKQWSRPAPLPPGPPGLPIVGNLRDMQVTGQESLTYTEWGRQYGEIVYLEVLGQSIIVINSAKAASELFDRRGSNYSDRPTTTMINNIMEWGWIIGFMPYGEFWRRHRKVFHMFFHPKAVTDYYPIQRVATQTLLRELYETPEAFAQHASRFSGSIILEIVYGYKVQAKNDPYVHLVNEAAKGFINISGKTFAVDLLPFLRYLPLWLPGMKSLRDAQDWKESSYAMRDAPFALLQASIANGTATPSKTSEYLAKLRNSNSTPADELDVVRNCTGAAYGAGADTTMSSLVTLILAMTLYPEVQKRAQAEIDTVVGAGPDRLPDFNDMSSLPYIACCVSEALRWRPAIPAAIPHRNLKDDVYEGYHIPAGSIVIGNVWAILHDESVYPNADTFKPERFWSQDGHTPAPDPHTVAFGFGRRVCPVSAKYLAVNSISLAFASILSTYTITKALDDNGVEITPSVEFTSGSVIHPKPFKCRFVPRSNKAMKLLQSLEGCT